MSVTLLRSATGGSNRATYETVSATFDRIFAHPDVPVHEGYRYGAAWSQRIGTLVVPEAVLWNGLQVVCSRPLGTELQEGANTRLDLINNGANFAAYVFSAGGVYNLIDPHGRDQLVSIGLDRAQQHFANVEALLSRVPEFNPGQSDASVTMLHVPQHPPSAHRVA